MTLKQKIIEKIRLDGPINFDTFMDMCLYYPEEGYYTRNSTNIGRAGDFYTSPHLHSLFGAMLAKQAQEMWAIMEMPDDFQIVEMGAGIGYLAKDMLEYLQKKSKVRSRKSDDNLFQFLKYTIVELNPAIRSKQQELLSEFRDRVRWISNINEIEAAKGCFLSNELLDAFPVKMVKMNNGLKEIYVSSEEDDFVELEMPAGEDVESYFEEFGIRLPEGYRTEVNLRIRDWLRAVSNRLAEGFILTVDYGYPSWDYYSLDRNRGTLLCYHQHRINENPYQDIGEQDITAHVNFSSLKKWGDEAGLATLGFCTQGTYLVSLGIDDVIAQLLGETPDAFEIAKIKGLIFPQGMGETHKIMIQYKGNRFPELRGFSLRNQAGAL